MKIDGYSSLNFTIFDGVKWSSSTQCCILVFGSEQSSRFDSFVPDT